MVLFPKINCGIRNLRKISFFSKNQCKNQKNKYESPENFHKFIHHGNQYLHARGSVQPTYTQDERQTARSERLLLLREFCKSFKPFD